MKRKMFSKIISNIAISFFFTAIFVLLFYYILDDKVDKVISLVNMTSVHLVEKKVDTEYNFESKKLKNYPKFGTVYASLKIDKIDMDLPIYHGDTMKYLRYGVGHYAGSYFPGENGTIVLAAHNTSKFFKRIDELESGDKIVIETTYGTFTYIVDSSSIVKETDLDAFKITHDQEKLIMYTCYPINRSVVGRKTKRYVVYAYKEGDTSE